jgi:hypothetical protein
MARVNGPGGGAAAMSAALTLPAASPVSAASCPTTSPRQSSFTHAQHALETNLWIHIWVPYLWTDFLVM